MRKSQFFMRSLQVLGAVLLMQQTLLSVQEFTANSLTITDYLVLPRVGRYGRVPIHIDPIQARLVNAAWAPPQSGEAVTTFNGKTVKWSSAAANDEGWLEDVNLAGGYAYAQVESAARQILLLEAQGHAMVFANGEPRGGDPYLTGRTVLPILLRPGTNEFLFHAAAGRLCARLTKPTNAVYLDARDVTLPTLIRGEIEPIWLGLLLVNSRDSVLNDSQARSQADGGNPLTAKMPSVPPLGVRKVAIPLLPPDWNKVADGVEHVNVTISLDAGEESAELDLTLDIADAGQVQTRTYRSTVDGSVQEYCFLMAKDADSKSEAGLMVTLHDVGEAPRSHLEVMTAQAGVHLIAPSGGRAEGCDWEDRSARNALEAIGDAAKHIRFDPRRVWLRGTGAGGHGVLRLGGIAGDRWAALAPRDPWLEYPVEAAREAETPVQQMLERIAWSNRLTPLLRNTAGSGILLQQTVGSAGSQELGKLLKEFHPHFESATVDDRQNALDEALKFCVKHTAPDPASIKEVDCVTYFPGENATLHWLTILNQQEIGSLSRAAVRFDTEQKRFEGLTANVATLAIDVSHLDSDTIVEVVLDGETVGEFAVEGKPLTFLRNENGWQMVPTLPSSFKQPQRYGGLRSAFGNDPILVYGTRGTLEERSWALAKARYDAETILVRHNGSVDVVADTRFNSNENRVRNVVLYGNASTNSAWPQLMSMSPVQMRGDGIWIERRPEQGEGLAVAFLRPRRGSDRAVVGVIGGNDVAGMRTTDRLPYFVNGAAFPDLMLFSAESFTEGNADVRAAGYFGRVWTVDPGEIVWRDPAL